eukprot:Nk52_evm40s355 gene=Nk52_evmTU40s355
MSRSENENNGETLAVPSDASLGVNGSSAVDKKRGSYSEIVDEYMIQFEKRCFSCLETPFEVLDNVGVYLCGMLSVVLLYVSFVNTIEHVDPKVYFAVGSIATFLSYPFLDFVLTRYVPSYKEISARDKRYYVVMNLIKSVVLAALTPIGSYVLFEAIVKDVWNTTQIQNLGNLYVMTDFVSLLLVRRMQWTTQAHHVTVCIFNVFSLRNDYNEENICRLIMVYATFSAFSYLVNLLLVSRFIHIDERSALFLNRGSVIIYMSSCTVNWAWQAYYIHRLITVNNHWTIYLYIVLLVFIMYDDVILNKWLLKNAFGSRSKRKYKATSAEESEIAAGDQRLIYSGRILKDAETVKSYGIANGHTIHLVKSGGNRAAASGGASGTATSTPAAATNTTPSNTNTNNPPPNSFGGFGGAAGAGTGSGGNDLFGMLGNSGIQQDIRNNPQMMEELMNNPMLENLMTNPEFMQEMMRMNPQTRQILEAHPELNSYFQNPEVMRNALEMMRNPSFRNEMIRNNDMAMRNIESHPQGFNHLRSMYENFEAPMMDAMGQEGNNNPFASLSGNNNNSNSNSNNSGQNSGPLPNPWAPSSGGTATGAANNNSSGTGAGARPAGAGFGAGMGGSGMLPPGMGLGSVFQMMIMSARARNSPQFAEAMQNSENAQILSNFENSLREMDRSGLMQILMDSMNESMRGMGLGGGFGNNNSGAAAAAAAANAASAVPPEERFASQLQQLNDMGFFDRESNLRALVSTNGNVNAAIERLLSSFNG